MLLWVFPGQGVFFPDIPYDSGFPINRGALLSHFLVGSPCLTNNIERVLSVRVPRLI